MATFVINENYTGTETVEADDYFTDPRNPGFIDFVTRTSSIDEKKVFRIASERVMTIKRQG